MVRFDGRAAIRFKAYSDPPGQKRGGDGREKMAGIGGEAHRNWPLACD